MYLPYPVVYLQVPCDPFARFPTLPDSLYVLWALLSTCAWLAGVQLRFEPFVNWLPHHTGPWEAQAPTRQPAIMVILRGHDGHPPAGFGTAVTGIHTSFHLRVITHPRTGLHAALANLRTDPTGEPVQLRAAEHEVRARLTDLSAVE